MSQLERVDSVTEHVDVSPLENFAVGILDKFDCEFIVSETEKGPDGRLKKCGLPANEVLFWRDKFDSGEFPDSRASCGPEHTGSMRNRLATDLMNAGYMEWELPSVTIYVRRQMLSAGEEIAISPEV